MDDFVFNLLHKWGLSDLKETFKDNKIDEESLYCLSNQDIKDLIPDVGPRAKFRKNLQLLMKEKNTTNQESVDSSAEEHGEAANSSQVEPSTSDTSDKRKRTWNLQGEPSQWQSPKKRRDTLPGSNEERRILSGVKRIMGNVQKRLPNQKTEKLSAFLKKKISDLETDKRELVGVFGKTGAGKSSLINAIIGEKNLLPSGDISACTSVMIKVEANRLNAKYEADIEFITKEEWKDELWSCLNFNGDNPDQEDDQGPGDYDYEDDDDDDDDDDEDDDDDDSDEKMSALYGEEWRKIPHANLEDEKFFKDIPEFNASQTKTLTCDSAEELSEELVKYTRSDSKKGKGKEVVKRWYWPLVKCVTVRVPDNDLLEHVTLVDLPGTNDRNKSRDKMWKRLVGSCSTVWIVTDMNRAASEKEPWEILKSASHLIGNGGECQQIHFICTKSDVIGNLDDNSAAVVRAQILKKNTQAKEAVNKEFNKLTKVKKHFSDDSFKVFTVSSKEFLKGKNLNADETEIPDLQEFLQNLNDCHSETLNYLSGAKGILSLIQGARRTGVAEQKTKVHTDLEENMRRELQRVRKPMEEAYKAFEKCLSEGVENSKRSCERRLNSVLFPSKMKGGAFHKILKNVVKYGGTYKTKKGRLIQLNVKLASCLTDSIDEEFKKTFPNEGKSGPFSGVIETFSLDTERLTEKYKDVKLQLTFLKTEEEKIKTKLNKIIRDRKKTIYSSLTETIEENMQECYEKAAEFTGKDTLKNMRATLKEHVHESKNTMFEEAKQVMLTQLNELMEEILKTLEKMQKSIELSLRTDCDSIPDFTFELELVKKCYSKLVGSQDEQTLVSTDPPGPAAALSPRQ